MGRMTERFNEKAGKNVSTPTVFRFCKSRGWRERGASLEDAQGVLPLLSAPLSAAIKKFKKSHMRVFFDLCTTVMLHRRI